MPREDYIQANRRMWNETAAIHAETYVNALKARIHAPDFSTFDAVEQRLFARIGLPGKAVVQLACNNGRELIAVKKAGAGDCLGVDLSDAFIEQARELATAAGVAVEFLQASVYALPETLFNRFDLVYITIGVLGWLEDLDAFFATVAALLRPGGQVFIYEMHPILNMFEGSQGLVMNASYFRREPFYAEAEPDYYDPARTIQAGSYWFAHTLGEIIQGCLDHSLALEHFAEYDHDISNVYAAFEEEVNKLPLCYSLIARKFG